LTAGIIEVFSSAVLTIDQIISIKNETAAKAAAKVIAFTTVPMIIVAGLSTRHVSWLDGQQERK
jgi:hypothetical protein